MVLQRKIRAMYSGKEEYRPESMPVNKYVPVIGFTTHKRKIMKNGFEQLIDQPFLLCIGNDGHVIEIVMFNLKVMIDEKKEEMVHYHLANITKQLETISENLID